MVLNQILPDGLISDMRTIKRLWRTAMAVSVVNNLLILVQPLFMLHTYDYVLPSRSYATLFFLTLIAMVVVGAISLLDYIRSRLLLEIGRSVEVQLRGKVFLGAFASAAQARGPVRSMFTGDIESVRTFFFGNAATAIMDLPWIPIFIVALFLLSPWLGVLSVVSVILVGVLGWWNEQKSTPLLKQNTMASQAAAQAADDILASAGTARAMGFVVPLLDRWAASSRTSSAFYEQATRVNAGSSASIRGLRLAVQILTLALAAYLVLGGEMTAGTIVAASIIGARAIGPIELANHAWRKLVQVRMSGKSLQGLIERADEAHADRLQLPAPTGNIEARSISVGDPERRTFALLNVSVTVPAGSFVGVVGASGAGKSTFMAVLAGAITPVAGEMRIDGADFRHWNPQELGRHIGYMPQTAMLNRGTVRDNIGRFGKYEDEEILAATHKAKIHNMILELPDGYDTDVGEGGSRLSVGQRQRIALARALFRDPVVLLFDEPTAPFDAASEAHFWRMIEEQRAARRTIFLITHRPSHVRNADLMIVLNGGKLAQFGPAAEIVEQLSPRAAPAASIPAQA